MGGASLKMAAQTDLSDTYRVSSSTLYWEVMDSPLGDLHMAADSAGSLRLLTYGDTRERFLRDMEEFGYAEPAVYDPKRLTHVRTQLDEYFAGTRTVFDLEVDLSGLTSFQQQVLQATQGIPWGRVSSYKAVAVSIGKPSAARAVGGALGRNPIGIVVPCHRVLASDGGLGGYSGAGGLVTKRFLLDLEAIDQT